ncbi:hypothetical protein N825_18975 [Skermanella stibiiresistens SB22]|uniref:Right handed beta helix domain-containing protein n=1 Tax=Skermanella stibiiresistens SB22 TaxID=1385369 RepID=W9HC99_9PROT|nr:right-handed parallel beta-helix repeat-containing protein [Skermanella stibiiresistens]EWY42322.1 hypothetical protein N825_18975 [Skermanella stibiiresistens SB22]
MTYNPVAISALAKDVVSFYDATPTKMIWVSPNGSDKNSGTESSPFKTIQAAVNAAKPGTAVMVKSGTYKENVELNKHGGTSDNPVWIVSADGKGSAKIVAASDTKPVIVGYGENNLVIKGFELVGGTEGIKLTQSGRDLTKMTTNIVIQDNIIHGQSIDGIKTAQSVNFAIVGNKVHDIKTQEGIDNVYIRNSVIANNEVHDVRGLSGIVVKAGSENVKILDNYVHDVPDGILVGGFSSGQGSTFPSGLKYEAKNVLVEGNLVVDASKHAVNVYGAINSQITGNSLSNAGKQSVVNVSTDNLGYVSQGIQITDNIVSKTSWLTSKPNSVSGNSGNTTTGSFDPNSVGPSALVETVTKPVTPPASTTPVVTPPTSGIPIKGLLGDWTESGSTTKVFKGGSGADTLKGTAGNDHIDGGAGADTMQGGKGDDTYVVGSRFDVVIEKPGEGIDTILLWDKSYTIPANVENLIIKTSAGATVIDNGMDNMLTAGAGKDTFVFTAGHGDDLIRNFQVGQDTIQLDGSVAASAIKVAQTAAGDLIILDGADSITLTGVAATTSLASVISNLPVSAKPAISVVGAQGDWKDGGATTKAFKGGNGADTLKGSAGNDHIDGGAGHDTMIGGKGDDTYVVGSKFDNVVEKAGEGIDTILLWDKSFTLSDNVENLVIKTSAGAAVTDNALDNILTASVGKDTFIFTKNHGDDLIRDFQVGQDIVKFDASVSLADIKVAQTSAGDMVLQHGEQSVTLVGVDAHTDLASLF